jgi:outer membrane immunogenic protein
VNLITTLGRLIGLGIVATGTAVQVTLVSAAEAITAGHDWSGLYAGVKAGPARNQSDTDREYSLNSAPMDELAKEIDGATSVFTGGALIGYNYQVSTLVLGAEADFNYLGFSNHSELRYGRSPLGVDVSSLLQADWFGTVRGRLGFARDKLLFYGTGGLAYGQIKGQSNITVTLGGVNAGSWQTSVDETNLGWALGAGTEYGRHNWSIGLEGLFVDLGTIKAEGKSAGVLGTFDARSSADVSFSTVRAVIRLRF